MKDETLKNKLLNDKNVLYLYKMGNPLYGLDGDPKYIMIVKENPSEYKYNNIEVYTIDAWFNKVLKNDLLVWECACLNKKYILKEHVKFILTPDPLQIRKNCDSMINEIKGGFYKEDIAKFLIHKILELTHQILENHKITNFSRIGMDWKFINNTSDQNVYNTRYGIITRSNREFINRYTDDILKKDKIQKYEAKQNNKI